MRFFFILIPIIFISCNSKELEANNYTLKLEITKLNLQIKNLKEDVLDLKKCDTKIIASKAHNLVFYDPANLTIKLLSKRPSVNNNNLVLCIPAAFTDNRINNSKLIDGFFIENGNIISKDINKDLSGTCIITKNGLIIIPSINLTQTSNTVVENKGSLFQQYLLLYNHKRISNLKFENTHSSKRKLLRRALVEIDNHVFIVESKAQCSIIDFQNLLVLNKIKNSIYLDMGTYSEGWYRNDNHKIISIGETMRETNLQSNWLVFQK